MTLGKRVKKLRLDKGLTQKELAEPSYTHAYVSTIEAGRRQPSGEALKHLAAKLGVAEEELATGRPPDLLSRLELEIQTARREASRGHLGTARSAFNRVAKEARQHRLSKVQARAQEGKALCELRSGDFDKAMALYEQAHETLQHEPVTARVDAIVGKAACARRLGDLGYAIYLLENLLQWLKGSGLCDPTSLLKVHASLVAPYFESGAYKNASAAADEALVLAPKVDDLERLGSMHMSVAHVHLSEERYAEAQEALRRAEDIFRQLELVNELGHCHFGHGFALSRQDQNEDACRELGVARQMFRQTASRIDEAKSVNELARIARVTGDLHESRRLLGQSLELLAESGDVAELALTHREMSLVEASLFPTRAERHLHQSIELYKRIEAHVELAATYRILGDLRRKKGDWERACEAYRNGSVLVETRL